MYICIHINSYTRIQEMNIVIRRDSIVVKVVHIYISEVVRQFIT